VRIARPAAVAGVLALLAGSSAASAVAASGATPLPPGVDALVSASAKAHTRALVSSKLHTRGSHSLVLAFVVAGGGSTGQHVSQLSGDGLRWRPLVRSDGSSGSVEVWSAHAKRRLSGRIVARLASAAYPASIMVVAYAGSSPYISRHAASHGRASMPRIRLKPTSGSLLWTVGISAGQRTPVLVSSAAPDRRVMLRTFDRAHRTGAWVELATARTAQVASAAGASPSRTWAMAAVDVVVPGLKRLIEEGLLNAFGAHPAASAALPAYCPPLPAFEVGVQDDPVFFGMQPAMSAARGFELATNLFHARELRMNVIWGQVKHWGWGPYDRAVQMAREHCWAVHMTIMWTPTFAEGYLNSELSGKHLNTALLASFASEVVGRYAHDVQRFAIGDEPDDAKFMAHRENLATDLADYDRMYMAGYNAIRATDPGAEVLAGEIGGNNFFAWLRNVAALPANGVGIHPYSLTNKTSEFVQDIAPEPLFVTEDGIPASEPHQLARDYEREELARTGGARGFIFYQLSRADSNERFWWNTGIE
jgi:hypothetical protein